MNYILNNTSYEVLIIRKKIKNMYLKVRNEQIVITCPIFISEKKIYDFIENNHKFLLKNLTKKDNYFLGKEIDVISISNLKHPEYSDQKLYIKSHNTYEKELKTIASDIFQKRLELIYQKINENIPFPNLKVRKMLTRWGVCNRKNNTITLNLNLIKYDEKYIDYVIIHELMHFLQPNHSINFWSKVEEYCPNYKLLRKSLRE